MRKQRRILDDNRRFVARTEVIGGRTYVYDRMNRRIGHVASTGTFDHMGKKLSEKRLLALLINMAKEGK